MHRVATAPMDTSISGVLLAQGDRVTIVLRAGLHRDCKEDIIDKLLTEHAADVQTWDDKTHVVG